MAKYFQISPRGKLIISILLFACVLVMSGLYVTRNFKLVPLEGYAAMTTGSQERLDQSIALLKQAQDLVTKAQQDGEGAIKIRAEVQQLLTQVEAGIKTEQELRDNAEADLQTARYEREQAERIRADASYANRSAIAQSYADKALNLAGSQKLRAKEAVVAIRVFGEGEDINPGQTVEITRNVWTEYEGQAISLLEIKIGDRTFWISTEDLAKFEPVN